MLKGIREGILTAEKGRSRFFSIILNEGFQMWIESENGTLYSINWIQSIRLEPTNDGWAIKAQFALQNPPSNASTARPHLVTTTLKKFKFEQEAEIAFETLKARLGDIVGFD